MNIERLQRLTAKRDEMARLTLAIGGTKVDPWFPIRIGDKDYKLEYDLDAAIQIFENTGINIHKDVVEFTNPKVLLEMLVAGLHLHNPEMTTARLKKEIKQKYVNYYEMAVQKALELIQPDQEELARVIGDLEKIRHEGEEDRPLATNSTSSNSGPLADAPMELEM